MTLKRHVQPGHRVIQVEDFMRACSTKTSYQLDPGNADTCNNIGAALRPFVSTEQPTLQQAVRAKIVTGRTPWIAPKAILAACHAKDQEHDRVKRNLGHGIAGEQKRIEHFCSRSPHPEREPDCPSCHDRNRQRDDKGRAGLLYPNW